MRLRAFKIHLLLCFFSLTSLSCSERPLSTTYNAFLSFSTALESSLYSDENAVTQPSVKLVSKSGNLLNFLNNYDVLLKSYSDASCAAPSSGVLTLDTNPVSIASGLANFTGFKYTNAGPLEETIYLKASSGSKYTSSCAGPIHSLHRFNTGFGYSLFQPGGNGAAGRPNATKSDWNNSEQIDAQGRYVITGRSRNAAGGWELVIWRYNPDGSIDTSFGNGATAGLGYVLFQAGGNGAAGSTNASKMDNPMSMEIDSQGRYVLSGYSINAAGGVELTIWRYNPDGSLDTSFGNGATAGLGYVLFQAGGNGAAGRPNATKEDGANSMQIDAQGRYVLSGYSRDVVGGWGIVIWRYNSDGSIDTSFGNGATAGLGYVLFQAGGNGAAGRPNATKNDWVTSMEIDSQGRYVISGQSRNAASGWELVIWRYNSDGSLDTSFGNGATAGLGYVLFQAGGNGAAGAPNAAKRDTPYSMQIDSQGRYVLSGYGSTTVGGYDLVIWRYNSDGSLDTGFGNGATAGLGYVLFQAGGNGAAGGSSAGKFDISYSMKIDSQGRYVLSGISANAAGGGELVIWRYNSDGSLDTGFGNGATAGLGYVLFQAGGNGAAGASGAAKFDSSYSMKIDSQGRYVLSGLSLNAAGGAELAIWRYLPSGEIDQ